MRTTVSENANVFARVRYSWYSRPRAIVVGLMLLGPLPQFLNWNVLPRAAAQSVNICTSVVGQSRIVQASCAPPSLENNAVAAFLEAHGIPASEAPLIYQYGRRDLRSEVRAEIFVSLAEIIKKVPAARTTDEQVIYDWFQKIVWEHEKEQYEAAIADRNLWKTNPCNWRLDKDVAAQYNLNYDSSQWWGIEQFLCCFQYCASGTRQGIFPYDGYEKELREEAGSH